MKVKTYLNYGPGMFWRYQPGDKLVEGPTVALGVLDIQQWTEGLDPRQADEALADRVWHIGNKMAPDTNGAWWPQSTRSLSTGDVLVIGEAAYTIESIGFRPLDRFHFDVSLSEFAKVHEATR